MKLCRAVVGTIGALCIAGGVASADTPHRWVQLGPGSELIARALTTATECPVLQVDGQKLTMTQRAAPTATHAERVCERRLPRSVRQVILDDQPLPMLKPQVRRIAVIGDTGCRIRGDRAQPCNDPEAWPLAAIIDEIVRLEPDLVIHVGDYLYRESPCPPSVDCQGSPYGYNSATWEAGWFGPAQKLLSRAPFIFVRGNHEQCGRFSEGWFRYLAVGPVPPACPAVTEPWKAEVAGLALIVFDASDGRAPRSAPQYLDEYRQMAEAMFATLDRESWFLTHRPLWVYLHAFGDIIIGDSTQRTAFGAAIPREIGLILSGHIHGFQALDMSIGPSQLISGNGGTALDPMPSETLHNVDVAGRQARTITADSGFGYLMLQRIDVGVWRVDVRDAKGAGRHRCRLSGRDLDCRTWPY